MIKVKVSAVVDRVFWEMKGAAMEIERLKLKMDEAIREYNQVAQNFRDLTRALTAEEKEHYRLLMSPEEYKEFFGGK